MARIAKQAEGGTWVLLGADGVRLATPGGRPIPEFPSEAAARQWVADLGIEAAPQLTPDEHRGLRELLAGTHPTQRQPMQAEPFGSGSDDPRDYSKVVEVPAATLPVTDKK